MVFGRKNKEINELKQQIAYLTGKIEALTAPSKNTEDTQEPELKSSWSTLKRKVDNLDKLSIIKKIEKIEKRLGIRGKTGEPVEENLAEPEYENPLPSNPDSIDIPTLVKSIPLPLRMGINMLLKQRYNVGLDEIVADPTKAIPILSDIMNTLNNLQTKKVEAEKKGEVFNPYDPKLFVR